MWKFTPALVFAASVLLPNIGTTAQIIKLKNGNEFVTARYWRQGQQIMFDIYGGTAGVDRALVSNIEASDKPVTTPTIPQVANEELQAEGTQDKKENTKAPNLADAKAEAKRHDDPIKGEFNRLKEQVKGVDGMLTSELRELLGKITAFKNKIRSNSKLFFHYGREFNEASKMGATVKSALESRGQ